jgi:hypothetical protein
MKTIKNKTQIKRVQDEVAFDMVKKGWSYCPKSEWKAQKETPKKTKTTKKK